MPATSATGGNADIEREEASMANSHQAMETAHVAKGALPTAAVESTRAILRTVIGQDDRLSGIELGKGKTIRALAPPLAGRSRRSVPGMTASRGPSRIGTRIPAERGRRTHG
jgi:hypothetical protein